MAPAPESGRGRKGRRSRTLRRDKRSRRAGEDAACRCPRDSTECCALLLRTCNPSKRHREGSAVSGMRVLSPGGPWKGVQEGYLGSDMAKLSPGSQPEGSAGSDMAKLSPGSQPEGHGGSDWPILSPRGHQGSASDSDQEEPAGSASGSHREGHAGSQRKIVQLSENNYLCRN